MRRRKELSNSDIIRYSLIRDLVTEYFDLYEDFIEPAEMAHELILMFSDMLGDKEILTTWPAYTMPTEKDMIDENEDTDEYRPIPAAIDVC